MLEVVFPCTTCFNTQPPEGGWEAVKTAAPFVEVSTHSRLKAAGQTIRYSFLGFSCFNTQPPEGGWHHRLAAHRRMCRFNTQPPEGGWAGGLVRFAVINRFQHTAA